MMMMIKFWRGISFQPKILVPFDPSLSNRGGSSAAASCWLTSNFHTSIVLAKMHHSEQWDWSQAVVVPSYLLS